VAAEHTSEPEAADSPGSVFGNLPDSRPGTRSPRRNRGAKTEAKPKGTPKPKPKAATKPKPKAAPKPAPAAKPKAAPERDPARQEAGGGIEDLAWAGVAAAAEAATLGVRLASRAIEALRGNPEGNPEERD
jgi:outer membrane biosynthesis protein TonB